jgi:hypothetical protein
MKTAITSSDLRKNVYRLLDRVLETRQPLFIRRRGRIVRITPELEPGSKFSRLKRRVCVRGNPEDLVHVDWTETWTGAKGV